MADMPPEELYYRSLKPPCPGCGQTNTRFRYFNNRYRTPGTRISSYDQPCYRCLSPCSLVFILGGRKNEKKKQMRSPKTKSKTNQMTKNGEDIIIRIPEPTCNPSTPINDGTECREDRSEAEVGTFEFTYNNDDDEAFLFFLHELFPELHGGDSDILMHKDNEVHITTSLSSSSLSSSTTTTTTTTAATVADMSHKEQQIYEELLMMLHEQELPPLSNYIAGGSGVGAYEDCSWWTSFDQDPFWASINF